jgi:hypothetical protein
MENHNEIINQACSWTPEVVVSLIGHLAWPIVSLVIAWLFKEKIGGAIDNFLNRNNVTELTVGTSGITAKLEASKQVSESTKPKKELDPLPDGQDAESIKKNHIERSTKYSLEILDRIRNHVDALGISDAEKIELLCTEASLLQAVLQYIDITTVLFRSQYDLFNTRFYPSMSVTHEDIENYFQSLRQLNPNGFEGWDADKYLAYPLSINMIKKNENNYTLTNLGSSYIMHIRNNPGFLEYLSAL